MSIAFSVYIIGYIVTLLYLILFGKRIHKIDYDTRGPHLWDDDFSSNAQAYVMWSIAWFLLVPVCTIYMLFKGTVWLVERLIELTDKL